MKNRIIKLFFAVTLIFMLPVIAMAADNSCGDNLTWNLELGVLTISGTGDMTDYASAADTPWQSENENIKSVVVKDGVTGIGASAFEGLTAMTEAEIADSVTKIGERAFCQCFSLQTVTLPGGISEIADNTFCQCRKLTKITIPDNVTSIGAYAFAECKNLISVSISHDVLYIGEAAFGDCDKLADAEYLGTEAEWSAINASGTGLADTALKFLDDKTVIIDTTPFAKVTVGDKTYLSGAQGIVRIENAADNASCTIEKKGYVTASYSIAQSENAAYIENGNTVAKLEEMSGCTAIGVKYTGNVPSAVKAAVIGADGTVMLEGIEADKIFVWDSMKKMTAKCKPITVSSSDGENGENVIKAPLALSGTTLYSEAFENAEISETPVGKLERASDIFGIYAGYGNISLAADTGRLTVSNTDKSSFRNASYPINVKTKDAVVSITATFPENAASQLVLRDSKNMVIGAIYRAADGKATFGASGERFSGTDEIGAQKSPIGTIAANVPVTFDINLNITGKEITVVENGENAAGVSGFIKPDGGCDDIASLYVGTEAGTSIIIDNIMVSGYAPTDVTTATFTLNTTPYAKADINGAVYYSGASGTITSEYALINASASKTFEYSIEKSGYTIKSGKTTGTAEGVSVDALLDTESGVLYCEDFETVSEASVSDSILGVEGARTSEKLFNIYAYYGTYALTAEKGELFVSHNGNGYRNMSFPIPGVTDKNLDISLDVTFSDDESQILLRDAENQIIGAFNRTARTSTTVTDDESGEETTVESGGELTFGASGAKFDTANGGVGAQNNSLGQIPSGERVTLNVKLDAEKGVITASAGGEPVMITGYKKDKNCDGIGSIYIGRGRGVGVTAIDNIIVREYSGTEIPFAKLTINTEPYAKITTDTDEAYYSDADGKAEISCISTDGSNVDISYTVEKGGYDTETGNAEATVDGNTADVPLQMTDSDCVYYEDFNTVSGSTVSVSLEGDSTAKSLFNIYAKYGTIILTADNSLLSVKNGGSGPRSVTFPISEDMTGKELSLDVIFPENASHIILRDSGNKVLALVERDAQGNGYFAATGENYNTANKIFDITNITAESLGAIASGESVTITFDFGETSVTAKIGENTAELPLAGTGLTSIYIGTSAGKTIAIDNLTVKAVSE